MFDLLFDRYASNFMGLCFDTGHGNIHSKNCLEFAERYKERLFIVHINDNHGGPSALGDISSFRNFDEHLIPFEGTFNWKGFSELLAKSPYELPYLLELNMRDADEAVFFRKALKAGKHFHSMVDTYRITSVANRNRRCHTNS
jgi:sugar phosphate isomerase/epimerase